MNKETKMMNDKALDQLKVLENLGLKVHNTYIDCDGWCDGYQTLWVIAEYDKSLVKLYWHYGNGEFFVKNESGGSIRFRIPGMK